MGRQFKAGPDHPGIDWSSLKRIKELIHVKLICIDCGAARWVQAADVNRRLRSGAFTGYCKHCVGSYFPRTKHYRPLDDTPGVDWAKTKMKRVGKDQYTRRLVHLTCINCGKPRWREVNSVKHSIRRGKFMGLCQSCAGRHNRLEGFQPGSFHPAINWADTKQQPRRGHIITTVKVTCPDCNQPRYLGASSLKERMRKGPFTGYCMECAQIRHYAHCHLSGGGYLMIGRSIIDPKLHNLFNVMIGKKKGSLQAHRLIMAKHLNRPLTDAEIVHHKDGNKLNNSLNNLRLFTKGLGKEGHHKGHGSYYQEWQEALSEIKRLREIIKSITSPN